MESMHFSAKYPVDTRCDEIETVLKYIRVGGVCEVVGMQGVGKSIFLGLLAYNRRIRELHLPSDSEEYHFVFVDFAGLKRASEEDVWKTLFSSTLNSLEDRKYLNNHKRVKEIFDAAVVHKDMTLLFQGFMKALDYLLLEKKMTVVLLLDTFEAYAPSLSRGFFEKLKVLQDRYRYSLAVVFSSSHPMEQIVSDDISDIAERLILDRQIFLGVYDSPGYRFLMEYIESRLGEKLDEGTRDVIRELSGGHAKLTKVAVEEVLGNKVNLDKLKAYLIENRSVQVVCQEIWDDLFPRQQFILRNIVMGRENDSNEDVHNLVLLGVLDEKGYIAIPLLGEFVKSVKDGIEAGFILNQNGEIVKGVVVVSDILTKQEYKLLRYFLEKSKSILSRDEIADAAWGIEKVEKGVSDQAIDQLVFRLRRKIEDDPNNPRYLLTIKGRGFQFYTS